MTGFDQATSSIVTGWVVSCGVVLVVAGASKLYRGARGVDGATAMSRALRMSRRRWRRAELTVGAAELAVGVLVCSGASPMLGGAGLASFGALFCVLLGYVRVKRIPGDCGCIRWRPAPETAPEPATWPPIVRGGMLLCAGIIDVIVSADAARAPYLAWFGGGLLAGGTVLVLLSMRMPVRTPICRRPLRRRMRATLRVLAGHEMFAAMTAFGRPLRAGGPVPPDRMHRRVLVFGGGRAGPGRGIPGEPRGAQRSTCRTRVAAGRPDAGIDVAGPGRQRPGLARVTGGRRHEVQGGA